MLGVVRLVVIKASVEAPTGKFRGSLDIFFSQFTIYLLLTTSMIQKLMSVFLFTSVSQNPVSQTYLEREKKNYDTNAINA